jgi:hypothetical protein
MKNLKNWHVLLALSYLTEGLEYMLLLTEERKVSNNKNH